MTGFVRKYPIFSSLQFFRLLEPMARTAKLFFSLNPDLFSRHFWKDIYASKKVIPAENFRARRSRANTTLPFHLQGALLLVFAALGLPALVPPGSNLRTMSAKKGADGMDGRLVRMSKSLSWVLRHGAEKAGLSLACSLAHVLFF